MLCSSLLFFAKYKHDRFEKENGLSYPSIAKTTLCCLLIFQYTNDIPVAPYDFFFKKRRHNTLLVSLEKRFISSCITILK
jgi:hypothetical protein